MMPRLAHIACALACCAALVAAMTAGTASARTFLVGGGGMNPQPFRRWVAGAAIPTPPIAVVLNIGACPGGPSWAAACALPASREIWLTREGLQPSTFFHELGHIFDAAVLTDDLRARFAALIHRRGEWAWTATNRNPPIEQFAEAYSMCARHPIIRAVAYGNYDYTPTPAVHREACALIRLAASRHVPSPPPVPAPRVVPTLGRLDGYPDAHVLTSIAGRLLRRASSSPSSPTPGLVVDGHELAQLTPADLLARLALAQR
jgi:hypothetical protein